MNKAIEAIGAETFRSLRIRAETGRAYSFYHDRISGLSIARFHTKFLPPGDYSGITQVQRQIYGKKQEDSVLYTGKEAYELTFHGARTLPEDRAEAYREATLHDIFYILHQRLNEPGIQFESKGVDVAENQRVETIEIYDSENRNVTVWLNANTFLPVKQRFYNWDPTIKDRREDVTRFSKYLAVNGLTWPHATERERDTEKIFQLYADKVTVNEAVADTFFELPNGIKMLKS